jgi:translation initiation factor 4E
VLQNLPGLLDRVWQNLVCGMIGEQIDEGDDICGAVISIRPKVQRIQVWVRNKNNFDTVEQIGQTLLRVLDIAESNVVTSFEFAVGQDIMVRTRE